MILSDRFDEAVALAHHLHRAQRRKGGDIPYLAHLLGVTALVLEYGGDEDEAIAALLHDAVEDQGGAATLALIRDQFGERVAEIVDGCSDTDQVPKPPWHERKVAYLAHLEHASDSMRLVSLADKIHNARALVRDYQRIGEELWPRFKGGGRDGTLWYFRAAADLFGRLGPAEPAAEFAMLVSELERLTAGR